MTHSKTKLALGVAAASITMAGAIVSPQAVAGSKAQHHAEVHAVQTKVDYLEAQLQAMQAELSSLRTASSQSSADAQKVQELDQWMASMKSAPAPKAPHDNMLFFRGGYAHQNSQRGGTLDPSDSTALDKNGALVGPIADKDGWYFGAGFDFGLTDNVWGMLDNTDVFAELMVDYVELAKHKPNGLSSNITLPVGGGGTGTYTIPGVNTQSATVNILRIAASPKIKFLKGSNFRPWLIPVGFEISVVSPPSDAITVTAPGMQFGAGADYKIWKDIAVGIDARYHYAPGNVDGININGVTAGGYIGIGF
jgi:opacity protein-like surface antigen